MDKPRFIPAHRLSESDLASYPVWQFRPDGESQDEGDESCVSPAEVPLRLGEFGSFLVSATFQLESGKTLPGAVQVDLLGSKVHFTPAFIYAGGKTLDPLTSDVGARLGKITKTSFSRPTKWKLEVHLDGESALRSGRIARSLFGQALHLLLRLVSLRFMRRSR